MRLRTLPGLRKDFGEARVTLDDRNQNMSQKRAYFLKTWGTYVGTLSFSVSTRGTGGAILLPFNRQGEAS